MILLFSLALTLGCGDDASPADGGTRDTGAADSAAADSATADSATADSAAADSATADSATADAGCAGTAPEVVHFDTDDGVTLEADRYVVPGSSRAAILLHMIPPSNDRTNYPAAFIRALTCRGVSVLNVDRRGAGGSGGVAGEAYTGSKGVLDARAAVAFMGADAAGSDFVLVGASNGTTTTLDYVAYATSASANLPSRVVFLSGGGYSTNQNALDATRYGALPWLFVYPAGEASWNDTVAATAPTGWQFREYTPGAHGTGVFGTDPDSIDFVANFVATP